MFLLLHRLANWKSLLGCMNALCVNTVSGLRLSLVEMESHCFYVVVRTSFQANRTFVLLHWKISEKMKVMEIKQGSIVFSNNKWGCLQENWFAYAFLPDLMQCWQLIKSLLLNTLEFSIPLLCRAFKFLTSSLGHLINKDSCFPPIWLRLPKRNTRSVDILPWIAAKDSSSRNLLW